jgi:septum formation protein
MDEDNRNENRCYAGMLIESGEAKGRLMDVSGVFQMAGGATGPSQGRERSRKSPASIIFLSIPNTTVMNTMSDLKTPLEAPPAYDADSEHTPLVAGAPAPVRQQIARAPLPLELPALQSLRGQRVILASASPRRKQLLNQIGLRDLEIIPCTAPEDFSKALAPFEYVLQTAEQKCSLIYQQEIDSEKGEPALVIAADTVVVSPMGDILEKPRSEREHISVLKALRNSGWHKVYTAVVCMAPLESAMDPGYALKRHVEETNVKFDAAGTPYLPSSIHLHSTNQVNSIRRAHSRIRKDA